MYGYQRGSTYKIIGKRGNLDGVFGGVAGLTKKVSKIKNDSLRLTA